MRFYVSMKDLVPPEMYQPVPINIHSHRLFAWIHCFICWHTICGSCIAWYTQTELFLALKDADSPEMNKLMHILPIKQLDLMPGKFSCESYKLHFLKLNDDKTELLIITTHKELSKMSDMSIKLGDPSISPSDDPQKNLGVIFDSTCCLVAHIVKLYLI